MLEQKVKKPFYKRWWVWVLAFFLIGGIINGATGNNAKTAADTTTAGSATSAKITSTVAPTTTPVDWSVADVNPITIKNAIAKEHWNRSIDLSGKLMGAIDVADGIINVHVTIVDDFGSQDDLMKAGNTLVVIAETLFKNPAVKMVGVTGDMGFVDSYGNNKTDAGVKIIWDRETYSKINFKNYRDLVLVDFKRPFQIASAYTIHPAIYKELKTEYKDGLPMTK